MTINRLGGIDPLQNVQKPQKPVQTQRAKGDTISVSQEAKALSEAYYLNEVAKTTPDIRADRVAEIQEKIKDPSYINDFVINSTAEKFMEALGL